MQNDSIKPFQINVAPAVLSDLQERLKKTRWSYQIDGTGWDAGTDVDYLKELLKYWQDGYDWQQCLALFLANRCQRRWRNHDLPR